MIKMESMEKELKEMVEKNAELTSIVQFYQINLNRISMSSLQFKLFQIDNQLDNEISKTD